ncbi:MAG: Uma2 family endonuclease [Moorea sp. SIOASIH]|nr:Uma2 family endonuclease [Moorena sp. SIOASIH]
MCHAIPCSLFPVPCSLFPSPDASWITKERWDALTLQQQQKFVPLCPDFVLELRSPTDSLKRCLDAVAHGGNHGSCSWGEPPRPHCLPKTALHRYKQKCRSIRKMEPVWVG